MLQDIDVESPLHYIEHFTISEVKLTPLEQSYNNLLKYHNEMEKINKWKIYFLFSVIFGLLVTLITVILTLKNRK